MHFLKEGQKIRAWVDPPFPIIRAMPERKRFFALTPSLSKNTMIVIPLESSTTPWWSYRSYELPKPSDWIYVAVAHGGHRDNGPVERLERNDDFIELDYIESFMNNNSGVQNAFLHGVYWWMPNM